MVTAFNILYSVSAVRRILGIAQNVSIRIQNFAFVIWVHVSGSRPTFISKAVFKAHFAEHRQAASKGLTATQHIDQPRCFTVRNESRNSLYQLQAKRDRILCGCDDYKNQIQFFGRGCCKHGYAVLSLLGFERLSHYIEAHQPGGLFDRLTRKTA